ncbi:MAG: hypothetical protein KAG61_06410 [Bacteriovoracaceae bacterium]|nr:hypothetical protein [Bacteriovoracaceae bacterium]
MKQFVFFTFLGVAHLWVSTAFAIPTYQFKTRNHYLKIEIWTGDIAHLEFSSGSSPRSPIYTSPSILKYSTVPPHFHNIEGNTISTDGLTITVDPSSLCARFDNPKTGQYLTTTCPQDQYNQKKLHIDREMVSNAYGLGEEFKKLGTADGDWVQHGERAGKALGNGFQTFQGGAVGNIQIPFLYAIGNDISFGLFIDNVYKQKWNFKSDWWNVTMYGDQMRFFVFSGNSIKEIRKNYLKLTGRPPVPPKKTFGLWLSKFGYHSWDELDELKKNMRKLGFPFDGLVLDVNWFGGIDRTRPDLSRMGRLDWDESDTDGNGNYFPNPEQKIISYENEHIGLTVIEESYVVSNTSTFSSLEDKKLFAFSRENGNCNPKGKREANWLDAWWGKGGMIDWSNENAGKWIHDQRRFKNLIKLGVTNHWTDLGEPEMYDQSACYTGVEIGKNEHVDIHNIYNFMWNKSIWEGYARHNQEVNKRPFIITRSGAAGTQRFGAGVWSADIASNLQSLATHMNAHMHMSLSGIDYFSSDTGGFRKEMMPGNDKSGRYLGYQNELYSIWYANSAWFDIPLRPHADNDFAAEEATSPNWRPYKTTPYLVGDRFSNKMNTIQRYELIPYYYSLAYRAHLYGEAVMPPMVYAFQEDKRFRTVGHQKMIGPNLMVGIVTSHGEYKRDMILPKGGWYNYHTNRYYDGNKQSDIKDVPFYIDGVMRVPVFAKAGSIIPIMKVDDQTMDAFGHRLDGQIDNTLRFKIFKGPTSEFTLYQDDGTTLEFDYKNRPKYKSSSIRLTQKSGMNWAGVTIYGEKGTKVTPKNVSRYIQLITDGRYPRNVSVNGKTIQKYFSKDAFARASSGWYFSPDNVIHAKSEKSSTLDRKHFSFDLYYELKDTTDIYFSCHNGWTSMGETIAIVGDVKKLNAGRRKSISLEPSIYYEYIWNPSPYGHTPGPHSPIWTKLVRNVQAGQKVKWSCAKIDSEGNIIKKSQAQIIKTTKGRVSLHEACL